jgi:hypothetical protein
VLSLTGMPLIITAAVCTFGVLGATVALWSRWGRVRWLSRPLGILLTEALLLMTIGLVVNRSEQFYPSWDALLQHSTDAGHKYADVPGQLDGWLRSRAGPRTDEPTAFTWQPAGVGAWHLAAAPTVVIPAGYLTHPQYRYPVVLVLDDAEGAWTEAVETATGRSAMGLAGPAVLVFAHATPSVAVKTLASTIPEELAWDLRVTGHSWAIVASGAAATLGRHVVMRAPGRYPALAVVPDVSRTAVRKETGRPPIRPSSSSPSHGTTRAGATGPPRTVTDAAPASMTALPGLPAGIATVVIGTPPSPDGTAATRRTGSAGLLTALAWACRQVPPPLAPSSPPVRYVPLHRHPQHGTPHDHTSPPPDRNRTGAPHGTGQSGR